MPETTIVEGHVRLVQFQPFGNWFLSVLFDEENQQTGTERFYQIDAANLSIDGRAVQHQELKAWLAGPSSNYEMARCRLTLPKSAYVTCEKAEFFSPEVAK